MLTLRDIMVNGIPDMEPVSNPYSFRRRTCPCCGNEYPSELYYAEYNECVGCDSCIRVEHILCD